ncbi:helix-turn-helix domain-containing protein [Chloroflexota bacterium]
MIVGQKGFFGDKYFGDSRKKLTELYYQDPDIVTSEKRAILSFWQAYNGLSGVLGNKTVEFTSWFYNATSPETITRCLRALKEDGIIRTSQSQKDEQKRQQSEWAKYWAIDKDSRSKK